jgi:hypothetical protein
MSRRIWAVLVAVIALLMVATPAEAIKRGQADDGAHPQVGEVLFYEPTRTDARFTDPGQWLTCTGTLLSPTVVVTAGHCTFGTGSNGRPTTGGSGGNDVWISFAEAPDFSILPPAATFAPGDNAGRYRAWSAALNGSSSWIRATAYPHPQFDPAAFMLHDLGVLVLSRPVTLPSYGQLPTAGLLDRLYEQDKQRTYTAVGYGLEGAGPNTAIGGKTRRRAELRLVNLDGVQGVGKGIAAKFSDNANTGGTCFGDSGAPFFVSGTATLIAVNSFGNSSTCSGTSGAYRIDQPDDLAFLATFGL